MSDLDSMKWWLGRVVLLALAVLAVVVAADLAGGDSSPGVEPLAVATPTPRATPAPRTRELVEVLSVSEEEQPLLPGGAEPGQDGDEPADGQPPIPMQLRGTLIGGGQMLALVEIQGDVRLVRRGDPVGAARIVAIRETGLDYEVAGRRASLEMGGEPASISQPPPPVSQPLPSPARTTPPAGLRVQLYPGHPLAASGLQHDDIIISLNGIPAPPTLTEVESAWKAGPVSAEIDRGGQRMFLTFTPPAVQAPAPPPAEPVQPAPAAPEPGPDEE